MHDPAFEHLTGSFSIDRRYYRQSDKSTSQSPPPLDTSSRSNQASGAHSPRASPLPGISHDDLYLFDHYIKHTCHAPGLTEHYEYARKIGVPSMAQSSKGLLCSLLALGATCLCVDILLGYEPLAYVDHIELLISKGDFYHGLGLAHMRTQLANTTPRGLEIAHAHSAVLPPFSIARRRIFRLLHRHQYNMGFSLHEPQADSPSNLEWMQLLRGVGTINKARMNNESSPYDLKCTDPPDAYIVSYLQTAIDGQNKRLSHDGQLEVDSTPSVRRHAIYPTVATTMAPALERLHPRLQSLEQRLRAHHRKAGAADYSLQNVGEAQFTDLQAIGACWSALSMLEAMCSAVFHPPSSPSPTTSPSATTDDSTSSPQDPTLPWLRPFVSPPITYSTSRPLTGGVLSWSTRVPPQYIAMLSEPMPTHRVSDDDETQFELQIRVLAWDIYAHYLVCMILLEGEAWWISDLGASDISKIDGVLSLSDADWAGQDGWWPERMRSMAVEMAKKGALGQAVA